MDDKEDDLSRGRSETDLFRVSRKSRDDSLGRGLHSKGKCRDRVSSVVDFPQGVLRDLRGVPPSFG